ncbi:MAG: hypothetical protein M9894_32730 [Planctomycetes bacterium]|nr:hypothetical protein [Planctomycetota bacterium]
MVTDDLLRRAGRLERLAALVRREAPAPDALRSVGAGEPAAALSAEGRPLDEALVAAGLVDAGEAALVRAGDPAGALELLAQELRTRHEVRATFRRAVVRPVVKLAGANLVLLGAWYLVSSGAATGTVAAPLPPAPWLATVAGVAGALLAGRALARVGRVRAALERVARALPLVGGLLELEVAARLLRALGTALAAGADLPAAFDRARAAFPGRQTARDLEPSVQAAREGRGLLDCLARGPALPTTALWVAGAALERADPGRELLAVARHYEERLVRECGHWGPVLGGVADLLVVSGLGVGATLLMRALSAAQGAGALLGL